MRIVIFDGTFKTTTFINRLALGLAKKHEVYILGFNEDLTSKVEGVHYVKLGSNSNKNSFVKTTIALVVSNFSPKVFIKTLINFIKFNRKKLQEQNLQLALTRIQPDIIHAQWISNIGILESVLMDQSFPVILSQRGYHVNVRPFVNDTNMNYLRTWYPKITGFHSVSKAISTVGNKIYSEQNKIDHVVYTGLNLSKIKFNKNYSKGSELKLISVGRNHWKKGYSYALQACKLLKNSNIKFQYLIVGVDKDEELLYLRDDLGLKEQVKFINKLPQQEVYNMMMESSLFLLPSIEEGIANVAVEAMALGTPVISTDCGGMRELITHNKEGWIVATRDSQLMALEIERFNVLSDHTIQEIRSNARKKIEASFSEGLMVKNMEKLYYTCINERD